MTIGKSLNLCTDSSHLKHTCQVWQRHYTYVTEDTDTFDTILLLTRLATSSISKVMVGNIGSGQTTLPLVFIGDRWELNRMTNQSVQVSRQCCHETHRASS